jgi:hypothetical protein
MKYLQHSQYVPGNTILFSEKCKFCGLSVNEILEKSQLILYNNSYTQKNILDSVPCLTEDEYLIKCIIE